MNARRIQVAALCVAASFATQSPAAELALPKDGWVSWQIESVEDAPAWCCWYNRAGETSVCSLDDRPYGYGSRDGAKTDSMHIYAKMAGGKAESVRALASSCPVESKTPVHRLANVATDDSARWLIAVNKQQRNTGKSRDDVDEQAIAALAMHRGNVAFDHLSAMARGDTDVEYRKRAIFWVAMLRGAPGADLTSKAMFGDEDPEVRKHAAFAITQSQSPRKSADLIQQGNTDQDSDVRQQAWFWLAQTGAPEAEQAIAAAAKNDKSDDVREHAVFALSQLPDERSTRALISVAEDRSLSHEQRKRALFWLAQSDATGAQTYLDKVLAGNATN